MSTPKFFDPVKFMMQGLGGEETQADPNFSRKVGVALQKEIKEVVAELLLTSDRKTKKELTDRLEKLQKVYQGFSEDVITVVGGDDSYDDQKKFELVGEEMSESDKADLLERIKKKMDGGSR